MREYQVACTLQPSSAGLWHSAGLMAMAAGQSQEAERCFAHAGTLDPHNPQYPLFEAQLQIQARRFDDAQQAIQRALAIDPDEPLAHASLAVIALETGDTQQAIQQITEARTIRPDDVGLRAQAARIYRRTGDPMHALELLIGLSAQDRASDAVATELALSYQALNQPAKVAGVWEHCLSVRGDDRQAMHWAQSAAQAWKDSGDADRAAMWTRRIEMMGGGSSDQPTPH
jgi:Flp pilus assembly protein TadD